MSRFDVHGEKPLELQELQSLQLNSANDNNHQFTNMIFKFLTKFTGIPEQNAQNCPSTEELVYSFIITFVGIFIVSFGGLVFLSRHLNDDDGIAVTILTASFAATSVFIFDFSKSTFAQPRSVLGSYLIASFVGVSCRNIADSFSIHSWLVVALSLSITLSGMKYLHFTHPPATGIALAAVCGGPSVVDLGYHYVLLCGSSAVLMILLGALLVNLVPSRQYPQYW